MSSRRSARLSAVAAVMSLPTTAQEIVPKQANISKKRKSVSQENADSEDLGPSTPKKRKQISKMLPPVTPTPAAIGLMSAPYSSRDIDDPTPPPVNRLVVPNGTNAPLVTPETHRVLANKPMDQVSPSKGPNTKESTEDVLQKALIHLVKVEPKLQAVIDKYPCNVFSPEGLAKEIDPFRSLTSGIISQQVIKYKSLFRNLN